MRDRPAIDSMERAASGTGEPERTKANTMEEQREGTLRERIAAHAAELGLEDELAELLLADGFDDAFLGYGERIGEPLIAIYDTEKAIEILVAGGLSEEEAYEHFHYNVTGAWVGDRTPMFITKI